MRKSTVPILMAIALATFSCKPKTGAVPPPPELPVVEVLDTAVPITKTFVGQTYGGSDIKIQARANGILQGVFFKEGTSVKKGQLLYTIDPSSLTAQTAEATASLENAKTSLRNAQSNYDRMVPLAKIFAVSQSELDSAIAQLGAAKASVAAAEASLNYAQIQLGYTKVHSPISGVIGKTNAQVGDYVGMQAPIQTLNTVSQIDSILVQFFMPYDVYLNLIKRDGGSFSEIRLTTDDKEYPLAGRFNFIGRAVDPTTGSILVQVSFQNPDSVLRPGQFAKITAKLGEYKNALLIPKICVTEMQGVYTVFVVGADNKVSQKIITVKDSYKNMWVVDSGLQPKEMVVTTGFSKLRAGMTIVPKDAKNVAKSK